MESFPPEMQTAILSPGFTSSYSLIALVNLHQMFFLNFFLKLCSTSFAKFTSSFASSASFCFIVSISQAIYPPFRLTASTPFSSSVSATSTLCSPLLQQMTSFFVKSISGCPSIASSATAIAPGIAPCEISVSFLISKI